MKILVTGAAGVVGTDLCHVLKSAGYDVCRTDMNCETGIIHLDVRDIMKVRSVVSNEHLGLVIHLAAETDVDRCQIDPDHAYRTNTVGTWNVALACQKEDIPMVYVSTAGVFDGEKTEPYVEFDEPDPVNIYGKAKLEGERIVARLLSRYFIVRAAWMIGGGVAKDKKFVGKIMKQIDAGAKELKAVNDKVGSITYSLDFSRCLADLIKTDFYGLYHMANKGTCTRYDVARHVLNYLDRNEVKLDPVTSETFVLPAPRARSEMLRNYMLELREMDTMRNWRDALNDYLENHFSHFKRVA